MTGSAPKTHDELTATWPTRAAARATRGSACAAPRLALPVASLAIRLPEKGWTELTRDGWNHFPVSASLGSGPFDFRVTAIDGQQLLEEAIAYVPGGVVPGHGQFR